MDETVEHLHGRGRPERAQLVSHEIHKEATVAPPFQSREDRIVSSDYVRKGEKAAHLERHWQLQLSDPAVRPVSETGSDHGGDEFKLYTQAASDGCRQFNTGSTAFCSGVQTNSQEVGCPVSTGQCCEVFLSKVLTIHFGLRALLLRRRTLIQLGVFQPWVKVDMAISSPEQRNAGLSSVWLPLLKTNSEACRTEGPSARERSPSSW